MFRRRMRRAGNALHLANAPEQSTASGTVEALEDGSHLDIHWDTVASELLSFMTMATLAMLYMMANVSALDVEELQNSKDASSAGSFEHAGVLVNSDFSVPLRVMLVVHIDIFVAITWTGVWMSGGAWITGLLIYIKYIKYRVKHAPYPAAQIFLKQFSGELKFMYWLLIFAAVCAMGSAYHVVVFKTPNEDTDVACKKWWGEDAKAPCVRVSAVYTWGSTLFFLPPGLLLGYLWLWREERQFNAKFEASRIQRDLVEPSSAAEDTREFDRRPHVQAHPLHENAVETEETLVTLIDPETK